MKSKNYVLKFECLDDKKIEILENKSLMDEDYEIKRFKFQNNDKKKSSSEAVLNKKE